MKFSKVAISFLSIILSGAVMMAVFSSTAFNNPTLADAKVGGAGEKLARFGRSIFNKFYENDKGNNNLKRMEEESTSVYLGGYPVGLKLYADGVVVVGTEPVDTKDGYVDTAGRAGILIGDVIKTINGEAVTTNQRVSQLIEESRGNELSIGVLRNGKAMNFTFKSEFSASENKYKAGIWIRDSSAGIGTVTFCTEDGYFASLGHAVCDIDTKEVIPILQGETTSVNLTGFNKGTTGKAGELCGMLEDNVTGQVDYNGDLGVYGQFDSLPDATILEIANINDITEGDAVIYTTLENGILEEYSIKITELDFTPGETKNLVIEITDPRLINKTGGIIQGMSGSPIVQNGRLIGAVTHVLVDTPEKGYGILATTMLGVVAELKQNEKIIDEAS